MEHFPNKTYEEAYNKFQKFGDLGVTAEDHENVSSTAPDELIDNPGKTLVELMTDDEILQWLNESQNNLEKFLQGEYKDKDLTKKIFLQQKNRFDTNIKYLQSINRLPENFKRSDLIDLEYNREKTQTSKK